MGGGCGIRMAWLENFLKIDNWGGASIRDLRHKSWHNDSLLFLEKGIEIWSVQENWTIELIMFTKQH